VLLDWESMAAKAGEPGWRPPAYGLCWSELGAKERAADTRPREPITVEASVA